MSYYGVLKIFSKSITVKENMYKYLLIALVAMGGAFAFLYPKNRHGPPNNTLQNQQLNIPTGKGNIFLVKTGVLSRGLTNFNYWIFENPKYPCGKQGNHQFTVVQKGAQLDSRNLLVRFVGGFAGFYYPENGKLNYFPDASFENLLSADTFTKSMAIQGLDRKIIETKGWRIMSPSYCSHDLYLGTGQENKDDGFARWGSLAASEAIDFTKQQFPTNKMVTYGTSAGSSGAFYQGIKHKAAGIIMDSFAVDLQPFITACQNGIQPYYSKWPCTCNGENCVKTLASRIGMTKNDAPYLLINNGQVKTPIYVVYDKNDYLYNSYAELEFANIRKAITSVNPGGKSVISEVCVDNPQLPGQHCNMHSPTLEDNQPTQDIYNWVLSL
jgi:hypothetical protein